jgi:O-antigen ligase
MLPLAFVVTAIMSRIRAPIIGTGLVLCGLAFFNLISIGSLYFAPVRSLVDALLSDPTFTGRTEIWTFAMANAAQRLLFGYGFSAFWGTPDVVYGLAANQDWANNAAYAHNAFLDLVLTMGIPGLILVTLWLVVLPLIDFYRAPPDRTTAPLRLFFLRIIIFAAFDSCFENSLLGTGSLSIFVLIAAFGLRFLAVARPAR